LVLEPRSKVLHHWSRCAGPEFSGEVAARHAYGHELYMSNHHRGWFGSILRLGSRWLNERRKGKAAKGIHPIQDLGVLHQAPQIELPGAGEYLIELSLTPYWGLCAGTLVEGTDYSYPANSWSWLFPGKYYMRVLDRDSDALLGAWSFEKANAARSWPLDLSTSGEPSAVPRSGSLSGARVG
jgi:hypothetical protein